MTQQQKNKINIITQIKINKGPNNIHFPKKICKMADRYMKRCPPSLIIKEMHIRSNELSLHVG